MKKYLSIVMALLATGCTTTSVTPVARNQVIISTSAAPVCGRAGATKVASRMAAVETIRRGYQRFIILGAASDSNVSTYRTGPTHAYTTGRVSTYGNTSYGNATTTFGGGQTIFVGSNDADLSVLMINPGEQGFNNGVDAKSELGPKWEQAVKNGIKTCSG
jgi:hypothetical protein